MQCFVLRIRNLQNYYILFYHFAINQKPPEMENGTVTLETSKPLPLYERKDATLKRQAFVIDVAQKIDEKRITFQVLKLL